MFKRYTYYISERDFVFYTSLHLSNRFSYFHFTYKTYDELVKYDALLQLKALACPHRCLQLLWLSRPAQVGGEHRYTEIYLRSPYSVY